MACFVFPTETNTGVRELLESKRPNGTNERVPSQIIKGGYGRTTYEFSVGFTRTTASDSSGDEGDFGNSWKRSDCTDRQLNEEIVPPYRKSELFERTSVFVRFALRTQPKPNETESIQIVVRTKTKTPEQMRISAEARRLAFPLGFVRIPE